MAVCSSNDDCRANYLCLDTTGDPVRHIVDTNPSSRTICAVPASGMTMPPPDHDPAVCFAPDGGSHTADGGAESASPDAASPDSSDATSSDAGDGAVSDDAPDAAD
jgi:hypothetical protein